MEPTDSVKSDVTSSRLVAAFDILQLHLPVPCWRILLRRAKHRAIPNPHWNEAELKPQLPLTSESKVSRHYDCSQRTGCCAYEFLFAQNSLALPFLNFEASFRRHRHGEPESLIVYRDLHLMSSGKRTRCGAQDCSIGSGKKGGVGREFDYRVHPFGRMLLSATKCQKNPFT